MSEVEPKLLLAPSLGEDLGEVERGVLLGCGFGTGSGFGLGLGFG